MTTIISLMHEAIQGSVALGGLIMAEMAMIIFRSGILTVFTFVSGIADLVCGKQIEKWKIHWFLRHFVLSSLCVYITKQLLDIM